MHYNITIGQLGKKGIRDIWVEDEFQGISVNRLLLRHSVCNRRMVGSSSTGCNVFHIIKFDCVKTVHSRNVCCFLRMGDFSWVNIDKKIYIARARTLNPELESGHIPVAQLLESTPQWRGRRSEYYHGCAIFHKFQLFQEQLFTVEMVLLAADDWHMPGVNISMAHNYCRISNRPDVHYKDKCQLCHNCRGEFRGISWHKCVWMAWITHSGL